MYHVQTEDSGPAYGRVYTHLFFEGTILASKKQEYEPAASEDAVRLIMQQQHKTMIRELAHGGHDPQLTAFFAARGVPAMLEIPGSPIPAESAPALVAPLASPPPVAATVTAHAGGTPAPSVGTPAPSVGTPAPRPKPVVVVKPGGIKRPPVVLSSSADGVVVRRNVVINVGGGAPPVNGSAPFEEQAAAQSVTASREVRMPWEAPRVPSPPPVPGPPPIPSAARMVETEAGGKGARAIRMPWDPPAPAPSEAFVSDPGNDKSLDEVILEYLSDDPETESR